MNFTVEKTLDNQVFTATVKFDSFGSTEITAEEEAALVADFGAPKIDIGGEYTGKYKLESGKPVVDEVTGDAVKLIVNSKKVDVTTGFLATVSVDAKKIPDTEKGASISTSQLVAEAKCVLFVEQIHAKLAAAIAELRSKKTAYEANSPETFTI